MHSTKWKKIVVLNSVNFEWKSLPGTVDGNCKNTTFIFVSELTQCTVISYKEWFQFLHSILGVQNEAINTKNYNHYNNYNNKFSRYCFTVKMGKLIPTYYAILETTKSSIISLFGLQSYFRIQLWLKWCEIARQSINYN